MKTKSPKYILFAMLFFSNKLFAQDNAAQSVINSSGSYYNSEKYLFEWNVGEMSSVQSIGVRSFLLTEGFLQPMTNNIFGIGYNSRLEYFNTRAFPTPAHNEVFLQFRVPGYGKATITFQDVLGRPVSHQTIYLNGQSIEKISISTLASGQYYLIINYKIKGILTDRRDVFEITKQ